jgi:hypothetical protein
MNYYHLIAFAQQLKQNNMSNRPTHNPNTFDGMDSPRDIWESKVGYDSANKKMIAKVYKHLYNVMEFTTKPSWVKIITEMLTEDNKLGKVSINGYYSTIRTNLKDIGVIQYNGRKGLSKGKNWDRFFGNEDWSWFITNTNSGGYGTIVK